MEYASHQAVYTMKNTVGVLSGEVNVYFLKVTIVPVWLFIIIAILVGNMCCGRGDRGEKPEPYVLVLGTWQDPVQAFLILDQDILSEVKVEDVPFAIISVFFVFNVCYTKSLNYVFTFLEISYIIKFITEGSNNCH